MDHEGQDFERRVARERRVLRMRYFKDEHMGHMLHALAAGCEKCAVIAELQRVAYLSRN